MMYGDGGMGGWGWLFGALVVIGLVLLIVLAVRLLGSGTGRPAGAAPVAPDDPRARARAVLDERFARGEISTEEYRERRQVLDEDR